MAAVLKMRSWPCRSGKFFSKMEIESCGYSGWKREKAPAALCRKIAEAVLTGRHEIDIWGDGEQTRSFTYIDDCVEATLLIVEGDNTLPVNVGSSERVSINQLISMIEQIAGITVKRTYTLDAPTGVRGRNSDNTMFREIYGWEPATCLADGLERTYRWIFDQMSGQLRGHRARPAGQPRVRSYLGGCVEA